MLEYFGGSIGLLTDIVLFGGIILFFLSFFKRFRKHKKKFLLAGCVLLVIGIAFTDWNAAYEAFMRGYEAGYNGE